MNARTKERQRWHRELSAYWQEKGPIEYCEFRFPGCFGTYGLAPAHSKKRRFIDSKEEYFEVAAACLHCHRELDEKMSHSDMKQAVKDAIRRRDVQKQSDH